MDARSLNFIQSLEAVFGQCLVYQDTLCDLSDKFCDSADGGSEQSLVQQSAPATGNLSPTPMSIESPLSYYEANSDLRDDIGNPSRNGSPPHIDLRYEESETDDPMDWSEASVNVVCSLYLSWTKQSEPTYMIIRQPLQNPLVGGAMEPLLPTKHW